MSSPDRKKEPKAPPKKHLPRLSAKRLEEMIEEATVDCYDEDEAEAGFAATVEDRIQTPFNTIILGIEVIVERVTADEAGDMVAVCRRGRDRQHVSLLDLPLPDPSPEGWEWIEAYRKWERGR